jgi:hypothetical protein
MWRSSHAALGGDAEAGLATLGACPAVHDGRTPARDLPAEAVARAHIHRGVEGAREIASADR